MEKVGRALWCVGDQRYKVETVRHPAEEALTYSNQALDGTGTAVRKVGGSR